MYDSHQSKYICNIEKRERKTTENNQNKHHTLLMNKNRWIIKVFGSSNLYRRHCKRIYLCIKLQYNWTDEQLLIEFRVVGAAWTKRKWKNLNIRVCTLWLCQILCHLCTFTMMCKNYKWRIVYRIPLTFDIERDQNGNNNNNIKKNKRKIINQKKKRCHG